jgi:2-polyprenyl-6-methoxyphenol hydroxylase-like FAD-dependent oxidoreductase
MDFMGKFQAVLSMAIMEIDRNYIYGIDRNKFDTVLWRRAAALPTVTACQNFAMTDVGRDATGRVTGIVGRPTAGKSKESISADLVVGADGRFSLAARKFGAEPFEELNDYPSASYHAEWEGVSPHSEACPQPGMIYQLGDGYSLLCIPVDKQKYIIGNYMRTADTHFNGQKLEDHYVQTIKSVPRLREMLKNARRATPVVGVRRIDNGYRRAYGDGWALVGDAFHYESPLDGQGFYNALLASKFLAEAIGQWRNGKPWQEVGQVYEQRFYDASHDMLKQTVARVQQELYTNPPAFVINTLMRWMLTDPGYQKKFLLYLSRAIDPNSFSFGPSPGPMVRGLLRDIFRVRPSGVAIK